MEAMFLETQAIAIMIIKNLPRAECRADEKETLKTLALDMTKDLTEFLGRKIEVIVSSVNCALILKGINFFNAEITAKLVAFFGESIFHEVDNSIELIIPQTRSRILCPNSST